MRARAARETVESTEQEVLMTLAGLAQERYISLTTFKRDGTPVSTPVWVAGDDGRLLVWTAADSWKVKRIKRDSRVRVAPCTASGKVRGEAIDAKAEILEDTALVQKLEKRKYWLMYRLLGPIRGAIRWVRRRPMPPSVTLAITPLEGGADDSS
jgi:PPOX class probable F420-dependent enzyme